MRRLDDNPSPLSFLKSDGFWMFFLWLMIIAERIAFTAWDRTTQSFIISDSLNYYHSGLDLMQTGRLIYRGCPTALIMPGISVLIGALSLIFPEGTALVYAIRIVWILMGSFVPLLLYKSLRFFTEKPAAFAGACVYLLPWHVQIDCYLLTECPYYLFFALSFYFALRLGQKRDKLSAWFWAFSILASLMFRANILIFAAFCFLYFIVFLRFSKKDLFRCTAILCAVLALFIIPWSIRNYRLYNAFIPVTYGASNPMFEGTYQGDDYPSDDEVYALDPDYNVYAEVSAKRPDLLDADGHVFNPEMQQYVDMLVAGELGHHRLQSWWTLRPMSLLKTYLYTKPRMILNWVWYYIELCGISYSIAHRFRQVGFLFCLLTTFLSFRQKRHRRLVIFLWLAYLMNLYILSTSYAVDRYAQMIMPYRYLLCGLGIDLLIAPVLKKHPH